jgi:transposase
VDRFAWPREGEGDVVDVTGRELNWLLDGFDIFALKPHGVLSYASVL